MSAVPNFEDLYKRMERNAKITNDKPTRHLLKVSEMYANNIHTFGSEDNIIDLFLSGDMYKVDEGNDKLIELCMIYNINMWDTLNALILAYCTVSMGIVKILKLKGMEHTQDDNYYSVISEYIYSNISKMLKNEDINKKTFKEIPNEFKLAIYRTSFTEAMRESNIKYNTKVNLDKYQDDTNYMINEDIQHNYNMTKEIFTNKKRNARLYTNKNPHFFHTLSNATIEYSQVAKMLYFKELKDGLVLGYNSKAFLLGISKEKAIRDLKIKIKHLQDFENKESDNLIQYTKDLIKLIEQKKHADKIPFKEIGKALGMSKNEAKNYVKKIIDSFNESSFMKFYEDS